MKGGLEINVLKQSENVTPSWRDKVAITTQDQRASKNNCPTNTTGLVNRETGPILHIATIAHAICNPLHDFLAMYSNMYNIM